MRDELVGAMKIIAGQNVSWHRHTPYHSPIGKRDTAIEAAPDSPMNTKHGFYDIAIQTNRFIVAHITPGDNTDQTDVTLTM